MPFNPSSCLTPTSRKDRRCLDFDSFRSLYSYRGTEHMNQVSLYPLLLNEISVLIELTLGHLRYCLTDVPPQPNSPPDNVFHVDHAEALKTRNRVDPASTSWNK